jgi:hypothetical protein
VHLRLTPAGVVLMEELYPRFNEAEGQVVARIGADGLPSLTSHLRAMVETVEDMES